MPKRIQRQRTRGWRMPDNTIYVGRPTKWGNPFEVITERTAVHVTDGLNSHWSKSRSDAFAELVAVDRAVDLYRSWLATGTITGLTDLPGVELPPRLHRIRSQIIGDIRSLAGFDLACWCPTESRCHATVLLELANA